MSNRIKYYQLMKKHHIPVFLITFFILIIFISNSCVKEKVDLSNLSINDQPKVGVPFAYGSLSLISLINAVDSTGFIKQYSDSSLYFDYTANLFSQTASQLITIPNQVINESFSLPNTGITIPKGTVEQFSKNINYPVILNNGAVLDTINFSSGSITFNVTSTFTDTGRIIISIPALTKGVTPFQQTIVVNDSSGNYKSTTTVNISGYSLTTSTISGTPNEISVGFSVIFTSSGAPPSAQNLNVAVGVNNLGFSSIYGYIGQIAIIDTSGSFKFNFFNNIGNSNIVFADPRLHLYFANSFGVPVSSVLNNVFTQSVKNNSFVNLIFNPSINPFNITSPKNLNQTAFDTLIIDTVNCPNLSKSLAIYPQYMFYGLNALTNPKGFIHNFVSDSSKFSINLGIELPFNLKAGKYSTQDTVALTIFGSQGNSTSTSVDTSDLGNVKQIIIKCAFKNGMPFDLNTQVYLCDNNYNRIDSLFTYNQQPIVKSAAINGAGKVISATQSAPTINFTNHKRIVNLNNVKYAIVVSSFSTTGNGQKFVKFYSYYRMNFNISVDVSLNINSSL